MDKKIILSKYWFKDNVPQTQKYPYVISPVIVNNLKKGLDRYVKWIKTGVKK